MRRRRRVEIVVEDPEFEQVMVVVRTTAMMLGASFVAALAVSATVLANTPLAWLAVGAAALLGGYPAALHIRRSRRPERITVGRLPSHAAGIVTRAGAQAERLRAFAQVSPDGAVADHFERLASTADRYVVALHSSLAQAALADDQHEIDDDANRLVEQLTELADAADELRQAQRRHLETSPLVELAEETRRLTEVIETSQGLDVEIP